MVQQLRDDEKYSDAGDGWISDDEMKGEFRGANTTLQELTEEEFFLARVAREKMKKREKDNGNRHGHGDHNNGDGASGEGKGGSTSASQRKNVEIAPQSEVSSLSVFSADDVSLSSRSMSTHHDGHKRRPAPPANSDRYRPNPPQSINATETSNGRVSQKMTAPPPSTSLLPGDHSSSPSSVSYHNVELEVSSSYRDVEWIPGNDYRRLNDANCEAAPAAANDFPRHERRNGGSRGRRRRNRGPRDDNSDIDGSITAPPMNISSSNLIIDPELLVLDMRNYRKLDDAIVKVKLFLEYVRQLAIERGLFIEGGEGLGDESGRVQPSLFVTIVTGQAVRGTHANMLRAVLQRIFRNRSIHFIDHGETEESFQVDALSGIQGDYEDIPRPQSNVDVVKMGVHGATVHQASETVQSRIHPNPGGGSGRSRSQYGRPGLEDAAIVPPFGHSPAARPVRDNTTLSVSNEAELRHHAMMMMQNQSCHQQQQQDSFSSSQHMPLHHPPHPPQALQMEAFPPMMLPQTNSNTYPHDQGAGMLYNPFDSIAQTLLERDTSGGVSSVTANSDQFFNALSAVPTALGTREQSVRPDKAPAHYLPVPPEVGLDQRGRDQEFQQHGRNNGTTGPHSGTVSPLSSNEPYPVDRNHRKNPPPSVASNAREAEAALRDAMLAQARPSKSERFPRIISSNNRNQVEESSHFHSSVNPRVKATGMREQWRPPRTNSQDQDMYEAVHYSQGSHIAPTRDQLSDDIRYQREKEELTDRNSASEHEVRQSHSRREIPSEFPQVQNEEELFLSASRQSIIDEQTRLIESQKEYAMELERALKQSEQLSEDEKRAKESEENLLKKVMEKSRAADNEALQREEELLQEVLAKSLAADENVDEEKLVEEVLLTSLAEKEHVEDEDSESMIEKALKLSLEEKEMELEAYDEEEQLQAALASSKEAEAMERQKEEELLKDALAKSLAADADVDDDELFQEAIRNSLVESDEDQESTIAKALRLSMAEMQQEPNAEEIQLNQALEQNSLESGM
mmetsp:Transcript_15308/g.32396  ORF Transcript_15308/g.32396 Transcript_15308/m.32396 type:complete len:1024 (+) Transcript_15308:118-3189(+)